MNTIQEKVNFILEEKQQKLLPENIKKDVNILGVIGTLEGTDGPMSQEEYDEALEKSEIILNQTPQDIAESIGLVPEVLKKGVVILGVEGILEEKSTRLPEEYQQVEYIESTGTQYIDTGIIPNKKFTYKFTGEFSMTDISGEQYIISCDADNSDDNRFTVLGLYQSKFLYGYSNWRHISNSTNINKKYSYEILLSNGLQTSEIDEITNTNNWTQSAQFLSGIKLFASIVDGNNDYSKCRIYKNKIYKNDVLICDFIPCYNKTTKEIGMFNLIEGLFYPNLGTGTFLKGADV